jgi:hypothetical protein
MSEETKAGSGASSQAAEIKANLGKMPLAEKVLGAIALCILIGWILPGSFFKDTFFRMWFPTLSFVGALIVAALVILKLFGQRPLPPKAERYVIPVASLLPVLGFLVDELLSVTRLLTVGGSIVLAYISATTYWRKHIPEFAMKPLGDASSSEAPQGSAPAAAAPSAGPPGGDAKPAG